MAPNGHASADPQSGDRENQAVPPPAWHERHGSVEFKNWQKENPTQHLSYEDWKSSKHVAGLSLYYAALHIWDESDSSDAEAEQTMAGTRHCAARAQSVREPKKTLKPNGHGLSRSKGSATPSVTAHSEDLSPSSKKKRKTKKKFLSQELVASDESEDVGTAAPLAETMTTPSAPAIAVNGRRKSSNRKPKKKPISEETISPEDEEDDPMAMNGLVTPSIASPLPVRSAPKSSTAVLSPQTLKKTILKLSTRKFTKKKAISEETVIKDDTDGNIATAVATPSHIATITEPNIAATTEKAPFSDANAVKDRNDATASPDPTSESAATTRRGLRTRRPAQQRPYSYGVAIQDSSSDSEGLEEVTVSQPPPSIESRRVSVASLNNEPPVQLDPETLAILQGGVGPEPEEAETHYGRAKHFKGKGRAWKKEESDEDLEFNPGKKKAARARAKARAQQQLSKKRGRPRKSNLSEDLVRDDSDEEALATKEQASPSPAAPESVPTKKTRKPPRKSVLSEAIVLDDTEEDQDKVEGIDATTDTAVPEISTPAAKKRGRPRKSDQSTSSKTSAAGNEETDEAISYTPKGTPNKSYTPKGEPKQGTMSTPGAAPASKVIDEDLEPTSKDAGAASLSGIEAHMASVNADDDDEEELCK